MLITAPLFGIVVFAEIKHKGTVLNLLLFVSILSVLYDLFPLTAFDLEHFFYVLIYIWVTLNSGFRSLGSFLEHFKTPVIFFYGTFLLFYQIGVWF